MSYTELHFHLLPGIDDGPATVEEGVELARAAQADGTRTIVATPHVHPHHVTDPTEIAERVAELNRRLRAERVAVEVKAGGELADHMVQRLSQRQLEAIAHGPRGRRWVLLEAPFRGMDADFRAAANELRQRGFAFVLAHPERSSGPAAGAAVQLTAGSFTGAYGEHARSEAFRILRAAPVAVIASDAHGADRGPALRPALAALRAAGQPDPERLAGAVPNALLARGLEQPPARMVA